MPESDLATIAAVLRNDVESLRFGAPVSQVYNPLRYAWEPHAEYLSRYGGGRGGVFLLGMNPGPWGMAQTGVPFGEVAAVRDWLGIRAEATRPEHEHPKRPVLGFGCRRSEVSGRRLWGWAAATFGTPAAFFRSCFVGNYCPLQFLEAGGRNLTPDKLSAAERAPLYDACDAALRRSVAVLQPRLVVGIGAFAEQRARAVLRRGGPPIGRILHPSPASPAANRGWADAATKQLRQLGVELP
ncbi:MAG: uracil-DNA glycosylase family protein [Thermoanaerobaculales bacterium]|jgi:single-strand selective monofunctional uracil DNA glycosylase|nr:uracil-DNA glycosylase family protein [Thermoanaerobaculales bacterium]